jgi:hypothetical protein
VSAYTICIANRFVEISLHAHIGHLKARLEEPKRPKSRCIHPTVRAFTICSANRFVEISLHAHIGHLKARIEEPKRPKSMCIHPTVRAFTICGVNHLSNSTNLSLNPMNPVNLKTTMHHAGVYLCCQASAKPAPPGSIAYRLRICQIRHARTPLTC